MDIHPTAVVLLQSLLFMLQLLKQAPAGLPAPSSRDRLCCRAGLTAPSFSHRWPSHPSTHPHMLLFSGDGRRTSKPSYSSAWETTAEYSLALCRSLPRPRRTVHFRWMSFIDHVDQAAPRAPGRWTTARPRKGTTRRQGRLGSCFPRGGEYDCTRVYWFVCRRRRITAGVGE